MISFNHVLAQNSSAVISSVHTSKLELKILNNLQQKDILKIDDVLNSYAGKIVSHSYGENKNKVFVFISDNVDAVDILQILKMNDIKACFRNADNSYTSLDSDSKSTRNLYFKE